MKYVLMFASRPELDAQVDPEHMKAVDARIYQWFEENGESFVEGGAELHPVTTATTVRYSESGPVMVDGPFSEAKEVIGGFAILDVPDMDAAVALVHTWPSLGFPGNAIEIRPMVEQSSQLEVTATS